MAHFIKELGRAFIVGIVIFVILLSVQYFTGMHIVKTGDDLAISFAYNQFFALVYYMTNAYFCNFMIGRYKNSFFVVRVVALVALGIVFITVADTFLIRMISEVIIGGEHFSEFINRQTPMAYYLPVNISIVVTIVFLAFYYYKQKQDSKIAEQQLIAGTASAKFTALKNQLDPHFLFNSLNVLTGLIEENPESAVSFTTALSKTYRYVLEQKDKQLVTVEQELQFAKLYLSLLKMRYEDSLEVSLPEKLLNPEAKVVPLSLQLIIENAVKHNIATPIKKLHISIVEKGNTLVISNTLQPKQVLKKGTGVGLQNIKQRYALLSSRPILINKTSNVFEVEIPLLTKQKSMNTSKQYISEKKFSQAKERVESIKSFYIHLGVFVIVMSTLIVFNIIMGGIPWVVFPLLGWGLGILGHASEAFDYHPFFGKNWEEKKMNQYLKNQTTMNTFNQQDRYSQAKEQVKQLKQFYSNLISYVIFIPFLAGVNYYTNELRNPWFLWAAFGWGLGILFQAFKTFNIFHLFGKEWEERKIKEFMEEEEGYGESKNMWE